jgi:hypothetical protein
LDREREGGGWGRIKYVAKELIAIGKPKEVILEVATDGVPSVLSDAELEAMHKRDPAEEDLNNWIDFFEGYDVFFSNPLDVDFMMQAAFPAEYQATGGRGPRKPKDEDPNLPAKIQEVLTAVLKEGSKGATYTKDEIESFFWYRYLFLGRGKPSTHIMALAALDDARLREGCPEVLKRLVIAMKKRLRRTPPPATPAPTPEAPDAHKD